MTALRYNKPMKSALRKAGGIFGLDLAGLFEEDDEAQSDFAPGVEFEKTTKGKGGGLYMRPQPVTGETTRLKLLPREAQIQLPSEISINLSAPAIQNLTNQVMDEEEIEEVEKVYQGIADGININDPSGIYGVGFGPGDLRRALNEGYTSDSIREYLNTSYKDSPLAEGTARSLGIFSHPGGIVTETGGTVTDLNRPTETVKPGTRGGYQGIADGVNIFTESIGTDGTNYGVGFGGGDLRRARAAGYSDESIKDFLVNKYKDFPIADPIKAELGISAPASSGGGGGGGQVSAQTYAQNYSSGQSGFDAGAAGIFGGQDVDAMRSKGYSDDQIRETVKAVRGSGQDIPAAVFRRLGNF